MSFLPNDVLGQIQAQYGRNPVRLGQPDHIELEIRFGEYSIPPERVTFVNPRTQRQESRFNTVREITNITFSRLLEIIPTQGTVVISDTTDCSSGDIRRTVDNVTGVVIWIRKERLWRRPHDVRRYRLRLAMSSEQPIRPVDNFVPTLTRRKYRRSVILSTGFRVDLTEVTTDEGEDTKVTYEIELEAIRRDFTPRQLNTSIYTVLKWIQNTELVYSEEEYFDMIKFVNTSLEGRSTTVRGRDRKVMDDKVLFQPRNLHFNDLVYGGIVGNPREVYKVTWKTDGVRKLLLMSPSGIWMVSPPSEANLIIRWIDNKLIGTILEGEYVSRNRRYMTHPESHNPNENKPRIKFTEAMAIKGDPSADRSVLEGYKLNPFPVYWFLGFDALARPQNNMSNRGDPTIQGRPHTERMNVVQFFKDRLHLRDDPQVMKLLKTTLSIETKKFETFENSADFFSIMRKYHSLIPTLAYDTDGYIFTPQNMHYNSGNDKLPLHQRVLTKRADICKYKPPEDITIDFSIEWIENPDAKVRILEGSRSADPGSESDNGNRSVPAAAVSCAVGSTNPIETIPTNRRQLILRVTDLDPSTHQVGLVPFRGDSKRVLTDDMIDVDSPITRDIPTGTVVEYRWDRDQKKLTPLRVRFDKIKPNRMTFARDNWSLIISPIEEEILLGNTSKLVQKYHNVIKRNLFSQSLDRFKRINKSDKKPSLLDIGSGWGGDLLKWNGFGKIIAVEPNEDNINQGLIIRIKEGTGQDDVSVITSLEDVGRYMPEIIRRDDRIVIVKAGGQDTDLITKVVTAFLPGGKADVVSSMLSLSFFWESSSILDSLVRTIGENVSTTGEFIFLTVNGDSVEEMFNPKFGNGPQIEGLLMGPPGKRTIEMKADLVDRKVWINIPNTIVENQTEWLVRPDDLRIRLARYGFDMKSLLRSDKEGFLTQAERVFTTMYSYGRFAPINEDKIARIDHVEVSEPLRSDFQVEVVTTPKLLSPSKKPTMTSPIGTIQPPQTPLQTPQAPQTPPLQTPQTPPQAHQTPPQTPLQPVLVIEETIRTPDTGSILPLLPVYPGSLDNQGRAAGDDVSQIIPCQWYQQYPVVRVAAIGDGSCYVHSILKSYLPSYANNPSYHHRVKMVQELRRDLAYVLGREDQANPGMTYYQSFQDGMFPTLAKGEMGEGIDYSLEGLQARINSSRYLGDEMFTYTSERLGVNAIVLTPQTNDLVQSSGGDIRHLNFPYNIFIAYVGTCSGMACPPAQGCHYEMLGVYIEGKGIQTVFNAEDPFIIAYYSYRLIGEIRSQLNTIIGKIQGYQNDYMRQLGENRGSDNGEQFLRDDPTFTELKAQLETAKQIFERSEDLQDLARKGSDINTLRSLNNNLEEITQIQLGVTKTVDES